MDEKELKTSPKQRFVIILIAVVMLGSIIASYAAIVINGGKSSSGATSKISDEKMREYEDDYAKKLAEFKSTTKSDFDKFYKYHTEIKAYNEASANSGPVEKKDLVTGSGRELAEGDNDYLAYYVGWCADESIFDSSFDSDKNPAAFAKILDASVGMIEGWNTGVEGMKLGGIRVITVPSTLAYGNSMEICGGYNKPLKFMIMPMEKKEPLSTLASELDTAYLRLQYAQYGIDYDSEYNY